MQWRPIPYGCNGLLFYNIKLLLSREKCKKTLFSEQIYYLTNRVFGVKINMTEKRSGAMDEKEINGLPDEEYDPDIVSVIDEDGKEHVFEELDRIETDSGRFVALLPVFDDPDEMLENDGEIIILEVTEENGESYLSQIEDEDVFNEIGSIFEERLADLFEDVDEEEE